MSGARASQPAPAAPIITAADHRSNNFDALRVIGALTVMLGHGYALTARPLEIPVILGYPLQTVGVIIFFSISGYLITASWSRTKNPLTYTLARCLRIFPALILVVLVSALVLGPAVSTLTREQYFANPGTQLYIVNNLKLQVMFELPGVWADLPYPGAVNGSLWTLFVEVCCYLAVPLLFLCPRFLRPLAGLLVLGLAIHWAQTPIEQSPVFWAVRLRDAAGVGVFFAAGAFLRLLSERFQRFGFRTDVAVAGIVLAFLATDLASGFALPIVALTMAYAVLSIGLARTPYLARTARFGDFSYGLYLWAFPVQQLVIDVFGVRRMGINLILVVSITFVLAVISWHLVERPSMMLKDALVRRLARPNASAPVMDQKPEVDADPVPDRGVTRPSVGSSSLRRTP